MWIFGSLSQTALSFSATDRDDRIFPVSEDAPDGRGTSAAKAIGSSLATLYLTSPLVLLFETTFIGLACSCSFSSG